MRYYTRAKELLAHLFSKLRGGNWSKGRFGEFRDGLRDKVPKFKMDRWKEGVSQFGKNFNRQKLLGHRSFHSLRNFEYERLFDQILSPQSYPIIHRSFLVVVFVVTTYFVGKMAASIVLPPRSPLPHKGGVTFDQQFFGDNHREGWEQISTTDLFRTGSQKPSLEKSKEERKERAKGNLVCDDSHKKSSLPLRLLNAIVLQNRKKSVAAVEQRDKKKVLYLREGDRMEDISVKKISGLKMVFANHRTGQCEYVVGDGAKEVPLWRSRKPQIVSAEEGRKLLDGQKDEKVIKLGNTYQIKKEVKEEILNNINEVLTQARAVEIKNPDGSLCFKMVDIVPGSAYSMLDIQNDDVICSINGKKIENLNSLFALFGKMREIRNLEMVVKRDGQEIPMEYNFE